jgi:hypothetical protein
MAYDAVISGSTGIAWFQDMRYPGVRTEVQPVLRELTALTNVLAAGEIANIKGDGKLRVLARRYHGHTVFLVANSTNQEVDASLDIATLRMKRPEMRVLFENRAVAANANRLGDTFAPYAVHIYTDAPKDADVLAP